MKYSNNKNQFKRLEWCFGKFIYRPSFPFSRGISAFAINEMGLSAFFHFLSLVKNSNWQTFTWDCWEKSIRDFHAELYGWIESLNREKQGARKACVILKNFDLLEEYEQLTYYYFQRKYVRSGFKMSVVISHPIKEKYGIGIRDIFFIFVTKPYGHSIEPIKKINISTKRII